MLLSYHNCPESPVLALPSHALSQCPAALVDMSLCGSPGIGDPQQQRPYVGLEMMDGADDAISCIQALFGYR